MFACSLHELQNQLRYRARLEGAGAERQNEGLPPTPFPRLFFKQEKPNEEIDYTFRLFSNEILHILGRYQWKKQVCNLTREQKRGIRQVRELINSRTVRLSVSDKGGEFVVIPHQLDIAITERYLNDTSLYRPSSQKEYKDQYRKLNIEWVKNLGKPA